MTGFLGAGKTTVINQLLAGKATDERWALLINEFGRIGIDGALLASSQEDEATQDSIAIREVSGGCICCTSQLPLQIAISRLLSDHHPQRLLIEPTGLAHPRELILQLSAPHWQTALKMQAVITVLNALQWQQEKYRNNDGFQAHVRDADVLVVNRYDPLSDSETKSLRQWVATLNPQASIIWADSDTYLTELSAHLDQLSRTILQQRTVQITPPHRSSLSLQLRHTALNTPLSADTTTGIISTTATIDTTNTTGPQDGADIELPYRYHETQQDIQLAGWRLPAHYMFEADALQNWLLSLPNWQRIKGVVHTSDGWLQINFTPDSLTTHTIGEQPDSRLEIILQLDSEIAETGTEINEVENMPDLSSSSMDWEAYDGQLMALIV